jgi:hypothetical protein
MSVILDKFGRRFEDTIAVLIDATLSEALGGQGSQNPANPNLWTYMSVAHALRSSGRNNFCEGPERFIDQDRLVGFEKKRCVERSFGSEPRERFSHRHVHH